MPPDALQATAVIQLTRQGTVFAGSDADLDRLRAEFERQHSVRLCEFIEPRLLKFIQDDIDRGEFIERVHGRLTPPAIDLCMMQGRALGLLHVLLNDRTLFRLIRDITGCGPITSFDGSVYRMASGGRGHDTWHSDMVESRVIAASVNLTGDTYRGGLLQIRDEVSGRIVHEVANTGQGDVVVFRLSNRLKHRVTDVEGPVAKTAYAGWFRSPST